MHREMPYIPPNKSFNRTINELFVSKVAVEYVYELAALQPTIVRFPDVSYYQGEINFETLAAKTKAVIMRAGQGAWVDPEFKRNYVEAKKYGLKRGIYIFYDDRKSPQEHFAMLEKLLDEFGLPEMEIWVDWENTYGGQHKGLKNVVALMELIEKKYSTAQVGLYTGYYWFMDNSNSVLNFFQYRYLKDRPLWLAWYSPDISHVKIPYPWTYMRSWQYGTPSIGRDMGVQSAEIDMNLLVDPTASFEQLYGEIPDDEGEPQMTTRFGIVNVPTLNMRTGKGTSFSDIGDLVAGTQLISDRQEVGTDGKMWWHLTSAQFNNQQVQTSDTRLVSDRSDVWAYGPSIGEVSAPGTTPRRVVSGIFKYDDGTTEEMVRKDA